MNRPTVTSELRKSIKKVTGKTLRKKVYSDPRKDHSVGVKICFTRYTKSEVKRIVKNMAKKGFELRYERYNDSNVFFSQRRMIPGHRFCFKRQNIEK